MQTFTLDCSAQQHFSCIMFSNNLQKNICLEEQSMIQQNFHLENSQNSYIFLLFIVS